jgi:hypothetical protein
MFTCLRSSVSSLLPIAIMAAFAGSLGSAQVRTLTDQMGRTIRAEVLSVEDGTVKIRREDGQLFEMSLANLSDDDQIAVKASAKKNPPVVGEVTKTTPVPGSVTMSVSRGKFDVDVTYKSLYSKDSYEFWGYNIQLVNTTLKPIEDVRVEYNIFGRLYSGSTQSVETGRQVVEALGAKKDTTFRTKAFRLNRWKSLGSSGSGGELSGVWAKLYVGDTLLTEYSSPDSIKTKEKWTPPTD